MNKPLLILLPFLIISPLTVLAQLSSITDLITGSSKGDSLKYNKSWVIAPYAGYAPVTSLQLGFGGKLVFNNNSYSDSTRNSFFDLAGTYTLNHQIFIDPVYTIYLNNNDYYFRGLIDYEKFPQPYFGIGNNTKASDREIYEVTMFATQHMAYKQIIRDLFAGAGLEWKRYYRFKLKEDGLLDNTSIAGRNAHTLAGPSTGVRFDSRNQNIAPTKGVYTQIRSTFFTEATGGNFNLTKTEIDVRKYWQTSEKLANTIAWQFYGEFNTGEVPFTEYAPLGDDMIMRGYLEGRFLDKYYYATQLEYRFKIWKSIRGAVFSSVGDVGNNSTFMEPSELKLAAGGGLRYILLPENGLSIRVDYALGKGQSGLYIEIGEAF